MTIQTAFRLESELLSSLKQLSKDDGRSMTWHVDKALRAYLKPEKKEVKPRKPKFDPIEFGKQYSTLYQDAWKAWCEKRKEMKKPISQRAARQQIELLSGYDVNTQRKMVWHSIQNDYQGLFELKEDKARESLIQRTERKASESIAAIEAAENALGQDGNALWLQVDEC